MKNYIKNIKLDDALLWLSAVGLVVMFSISDFLFLIKSLGITLIVLNCVSVGLRHLLSEILETVYKAKDRFEGILIILKYATWNVSLACNVGIAFVVLCIWKSLN